MELQQGIEIVKRAIRKVIPQDIEVDEKQNLLECMGALDLFYVVSFLEEESYISWENVLEETPEKMTISGLAKLLL